MIFQMNATKLLTNLEISCVIVICRNDAIVQVGGGLTCQHEVGQAEGHPVIWRHQGLVLTILHFLS